MDLTVMLFLVGIFTAIIFFIIGFFVARYYYFNQYEELLNIKAEHESWRSKLKAVQDELWSINQEITSKKEEVELTKKETADKIQQLKKGVLEEKTKADKEVTKFQKLQAQAKEGVKTINTAINQKKQTLTEIDKKTATLQQMLSKRKEIETAYAELPSKIEELEHHQTELSEIKSEISLYTEMDEFIDYGVYPLPSYGEASSGAYNEKLKTVRSEQKQMLKDMTAYTFPAEIEITGNTTFDKRLVKNQGILLITAFNSQCDYLINKINSKNYEATLTKIEKLAEQLEKRLLSLEIGVSLEYVKLKMEECSVYYQYICQKQAEAEEQRQIRAQIREETAAQREIERAIREAQKEEDMLQKAMEKARRELENASAEQKQKYELQLKELTEKLAEAESKEERALSMAQQTKRGHVYVISNIGSFGEDIYKIGMTRRLEPLDRVKELGDASVPFTFDVHAMIYSEDAPALEKELHTYFELASVNKVNNRKEFFELNIKDIKGFVEEQGYETRWTMLADATEFRQSLVIAEQQNQKLVA